MKYHMNASYIAGDKESQFEQSFIANSDVSAGILAQSIADSHTRDYGELTSVGYYKVQETESEDERP